MTVHFHEEDLPVGVLAPGPIAVDTETMGLITPRDRLCVVQISDGKGALLAFVGGVVTACALDLTEFADNDAVAHDRVERWLDNARCAAGEADDDEVFRQGSRLRVG